MLSYDEAVIAACDLIAARRAAKNWARRKASQETFGHPGASIPGEDTTFTEADAVRAVLDTIAYGTGEATVSHRGVTATVHVEDDPVVEGRVRVRLSAERTPWNAFSGLDADDLYSFGGLYPNDPDPA